MMAESVVGGAGEDGLRLLEVLNLAAQSLRCQPRMVSGVLTRPTALGLSRPRLQHAGVNADVGESSFYGIKRKSNVVRKGHAVRGAFVRWRSVESSVGRRE